MKERAVCARKARWASALAVVAGVTTVALTARVAGADLVLTTEGKWYGLPAPAAGEQPLSLGAEDEPTDEMLVQSEGFKVDATYETVKATGGVSKPAGIVRKIRAHDRAKNEDFKKALNDMSSSLWKDAADEFGAAAGALSGWDKQEALWGRVQAYAGLGTAPEVLSSIDDLLAAFPKTFYFADAQILRAKIAASKDDLAGAEKALTAVAAEKGMNLRDQYRAEYVRINLILETKQRKYDEAQQAYKRLLETIARGDAAQGEVAALQANVGIGNCLLATRKGKEAAPYLLKATESHNMDVLAGAYAGLGDIALIEAGALREAKKLKEAKEKLEEASLHYLRVTLYYRDGVEDDSTVLRAFENQGAVFIALFEMSNPKDMELFDRGYNSYFDLWKSLTEGSPQKKAINKKLNELKAMKEGK